MSKVEIFADGACKGNPGTGGWGALLVADGHEKEIFGGEAEILVPKHDEPSAVG